MAVLNLNFKMGPEGQLPTEANMTTGTVYFTSDGNYGKIWYKDGDNHKVNIIPHILDGGSLNTATYVCCFMPGSQVMLNINGDTKNIEDIKSGDRVLSYNIFTDTFYEVIVQQLLINKNTTHLAQVFLENGFQLEMNEYHPIYTENGFHSLTNHNGYDTLVIGDNVKTNNGWSKIIDIKTYQVKTPIITYNLAIKDLDEDKDDDTYDTFIVNSAVVHNAACPT